MGMAPRAPCYACCAAGDARGSLLVFTDANVEFRAVVPPGAAVEVRSRRRFFRRRKLSSEVEMVAEDGSPVCQGVISGMAVAR